MAFPTIATTGSGHSTSASTTYTITIPAGAAGDLILVCLGYHPPSHPAPNIGAEVQWPAGWINEFQGGVDEYTIRVWEAMRISDGTETSVAVTLTMHDGVTPVSAWWAHTVYRIQNYRTGVAFPIIPMNSSGYLGGAYGFTTMTLLPTGLTQDYLFLAVGAFTDGTVSITGAQTPSTPVWGTPVVEKTGSTLGVTLITAALALRTSFYDAHDPATPGGLLHWPVSPTTPASMQHMLAILPNEPLPFPTSGTPTVVGSLSGMTSATATSHSIPLPAGSAGELLVAIVNGSPSTNTPQVLWPSGWEKYHTRRGAGRYGSIVHTGIRTADGTESSVTVTFTEAARACYIVYRITGQKTGVLLPFIDIGRAEAGYADANSRQALLCSPSIRPAGETSYPGLVISVSYRNKPNTTVASPIDCPALEVADPATRGTRLYASASPFVANPDVQPLPWVVNPSNCKWSSTTSGDEEEHFTLFVQSNLPSQALDLPSQTYAQTWSVLKEDSGMFVKDGYVERPPAGGHAPDPDYPEVLTTQVVRVAVVNGRNALDVSATTPDAYDSWPYYDSGLGLVEIGHLGATPGNPAAGTSAPWGGWYNAEKGRFTADWDLLTNAWTAEPMGVMAALVIGDWELAPLLIVGDVRIDEPWVGGVPDPSDFAQFWFRCYTQFDGQIPYWTNGFENDASQSDQYYGLFGLTMMRSRWENKRVRFIVEWQCGTLVADPRTPEGVISQPDGFIRVTLEDLDSHVQTVVFDVPNIPLQMVLNMSTDWGDSYPEAPGRNHLNGALIGYYGMFGANLGFALDAGGAVALPEVELASNIIGLTWVEFTEEIPPVFIPTKTAPPPDWDVAPKRRAKPRARPKKRGPNG